MRKKAIELLMAVLLLVGAFFLSKEGAELVSKELAQDAKVIVVDAGHGGIDPGVIGIGGLKEKDINLQIAKKVKKKLEKEGYTIVMTRTKDEGLYEENTNNKKVQDMQNRCNLIKEKKPVMTISIHQNSYPDASVCGPQVFYFTHSAEGAKLGKSIQDQLNTYLEVARPRVEKGNSTYYLLKKSEGVLTIVECGFLTNPDEAAKLQTKEYQDKVAEAVCQGVLEYLGNK
ncbi:N-acetylmuramoyl-L-alanine amidase [Lactonifactor longoviformis]|uniref:N-acetylmuramoyl-L-alanine amidase n=1 Tax=Lactonifactor longoviformis DSM 17459 TaxID=1122155 RepID=A0A1M4Y266_9CLOT|nr:N-acetylmuramoyl-L-alanine amidase [Lactonifactor longoviformis]POP30867.1 N-acetylmuramoyl-L-alanine amidase [Lactonifactor longoviformis]SHE99779.1 N-acetylmuramoyl-L-alanine amidase [Lactonifactor longoviformis DSM 17459]